jgi:GNAT superfamily N-acetyltransferase
MQVTVEPVRGGRDLRAFIRFPLAHYRNAANYVPHLLGERRKFFGPGNPLFEFTDVSYFLARDARGRVLGRVTAHVNRRHNESLGETTGFFGFFESVPDAAVAGALMAAAENDLRERGMTVARGPFNFSTNEECGLLTSGFDAPPAVMMPYTHPYYPDLLRQLGYRKVKGLLAYDYSYPGAIPEHLVRFGAIVRKRTGVTVRALDPRRYNADVGAALRLYNAAWEENWGFVPMTDAEFRYAARELRSVLDPRVVLIAEKQGEPVAFSLSLPDYTGVLKKMRGRLFPFGFLHLLAGRRNIHRVRVVMLGVLPAFRRSGIDALLYYETFRRGVARGYVSCEMSWVLEDNAAMRRPLERMGATVCKVYHILEKAL